MYDVRSWIGRGVPNVSASDQANDPNSINVDEIKWNKYTQTYAHNLNKLEWFDKT